jgi:LysR family transcriptional regulator, benzoate and cis,cis-muconate-responsive activator of ben and cat genes
MQQMELRDLRYFLAVAEARSFTRAAERLHMAQPPLSRRIATLEARCGVLLLRRERPLELTDAGRFLAEQARQILGRLAEVEGEVRRIGLGRRHFFAIGFVGSTLYGPLPRAIRAFRESYPDVEIGLFELTTHEQRVALEERRIDVGFGRLHLPEAPDLSREVLVDELLWLAVTPDHALLGKPVVTLGEIATEPFLLYPARPRPSYADQVLALTRAAGVELNVALEANDLQAALGLVAAGMGVTLVPASVAALRRDDISFIPSEDEALRSPVIVSHRKADTSPLLRTFLSLAWGGVDREA